MSKKVRSKNVKSVILIRAFEASRTTGPQMRIRSRTRNQNPDRSSPDPGPESAPVQEWPDPDSDFSLSLFFFSFNAFKVMKERCKAKVTAKSNSNPDFFLWYRCVLLWCWPIFLYPSNGHFFLFVVHNGHGSQPGPAPTFVGSRSVLGSDTQKCIV